MKCCFTEPSYTSPVLLLLLFRASWILQQAVRRRVWGDESCDLVKLLPPTYKMHMSHRSGILQISLFLSVDSQHFNSPGYLFLLLLTEALLRGINTTFPFCNLALYLGTTGTKSVLLHSQHKSSYISTQINAQLNSQSLLPLAPLELLLWSCITPCLSFRQTAAARIQEDDWLMVLPGD